MGFSVELVSNSGVGFFTVSYLMKETEPLSEKHHGFQRQE
jgi:hypothetical protein